MQIVIDIPEYVYEDVLKENKFLNRAIIQNAFENGIILPKEHGDLIDRKELTKYPPIWMQDNRRTGDDTPVVLLSDILNAHVIIPAEESADIHDIHPQRITGRWIKTEKCGEPTLCSICGTRWDTDYVESRELYYTGKIPKFCPECGNPMEVIRDGG